MGNHSCCQWCPARKLGKDPKQMGNCWPNRQQFPTKGWGFPTKCGTVVWTTSSSQRGTSDSRQTGSWLESQSDRELDTKRTELRTDRTYPQPAATVRKTVNSKRGSWVPCLCSLLSPNAIRGSLWILPLPPNLLKKQNSTEYVLKV